MAVRRPIVDVGGTLQELPSGDTVVGAIGSGINYGTTTINFGNYPGANEASIAVTGLTGISATSKPRADVSLSGTAGTHSVNDHKYLANFAGITCSVPTAGVGFTIYVTSMHKFQGQYRLDWLWFD